MIIDTTYSRELAKSLLDINAVVLRPNNPFTWSSGWNSPIYCDNRLTMAHPRIRRTIRDGFAAVIDERKLTPDVIVGTATAGIPHAAWLAERLDLPMAYVRSSAKGHGRQNQIEGRIPPGASVVIIEDLVSTGGSALNAVDAVQEAGATVEAVLAIYARENGKGLIFPEEAESEEEKESDRDALQAWRRSPEQWSAAHA